MCRRGTSEPLTGAAYPLFTLDVNGAYSVSGWQNEQYCSPPFLLRGLSIGQHNETVNYNYMAADGTVPHSTVFSTSRVYYPFFNQSWCSRRVRTVVGTTYQLRYHNFYYMDVVSLKNYDGSNKTLKQFDSDYSRYPFNTVNQYSQIGIDAILKG